MGDAETVVSIKKLKTLNWLTTANGWKKYFSYGRRRKFRDRIPVFCLDSFNTSKFHRHSCFKKEKNNYLSQSN
ncbi:MAG: hypothetical protein C0433_11740 [Cyclobacterium sp.]|nr:hypothetical protein [Cyclobacterium sp.]